VVVTRARTPALQIDSLVVPAGFLFGSGTAGIKASGNPDVAFAEAPLGASAAAMFTRNLVCAAPVVVGREHLKRTRGRVRAVIVNAGNANCATGDAGLRAAETTCVSVGEVLSAAPEFIIPSSTGVIGVPLPVAKLTMAVPTILASKADDAAAVERFARAIMTTDTRPKIANRTFTSGKQTVSVLGVAKGAGMIHPNMATMLVYLFTDVDASPAALKPLLKSAVDKTLNCITVDGDTSTNDTVLLLASGDSGVALHSTGTAKKFANALENVCASIAEQIVSDGEGVQHVIELTVAGASSDRAADQIARTIAHSMLVKTAWAGADPNWGRIVAAVGRSGIKVDPYAIDVRIGPHIVCRGGMSVAFDQRGAHAEMEKPRYPIEVRVGKGKGTARLLTCDLTADYVRINADYTT
jgi:glutamate N-acetyltransferase/amino-acid N-acetyltransferase